VYAGIERIIGAIEKMNHFEVCTPPPVPAGSARSMSRHNIDMSSIRIRHYRFGVLSMRSMWDYLMVMLGILLIVGLIVLVWKIFFEPCDEYCEAFEGQAP